MDIRPVAPAFAVSPPITPDEVARLAAAGFRAIVNNRPDGEEEGQPGSAEIEAAARRAGLDYRFIPITPGQLVDEKVEAFRDALEQLSGPVLAFCRTGTRSVSLWALAEAGRSAPAELATKAAAAGYDLSALRPRLEALAARHRRDGEA